jgi:hypothetical protein
LIDSLFRATTGNGRHTKQLSILYGGTGWIIQLIQQPKDLLKATEQGFLGWCGFLSPADRTIGKTTLIGVWFSIEMGIWDFWIFKVTFFAHFLYHFWLLDIILGIKD